MHCRIVCSLHQKALLGTLHLSVLRCAHACCWLARAICVPIRACVRERAGVLCCGSLASYRGLGERAQLAHHCGSKMRFFSQCLVVNWLGVFKVSNWVVDWYAVNNRTSRNMIFIVSEICFHTQIRDCFK